MIEIPVHNQAGKKVASIKLDEQLLGGEVRLALLKQAYVRQHANRRQGTSKTKTRSETAYSGRKLYRQKGSGNARRGSRGANILRGGGHGLAKRPHSWRQRMPKRMRQLANRNALLAKAVDGQIKLVDDFKFDQPSTKSFNLLLNSLKINRSCLFASDSIQSPAARSAQNLLDVSLTHIDRLNVFDLLNHWFVLSDRKTFETYLNRLSDHPALSPQPGAQDTGKKDDS